MKAAGPIASTIATSSMCTLPSPFAAACHQYDAMTTPSDKLLTAVLVPTLETQLVSDLRRYSLTSKTSDNSDLINQPSGVRPTKQSDKPVNC